MPRSLVAVLAWLSLLVVYTHALSTNNIPWSPRCSQQQEQERLYVSTLDGVITALDAAEGRQLWRHLLKRPLFSSTLSYSKPRHGIPNLIPGLDKSMYHWDGTQLTKLSMTADDLIQRNFVPSPGLVQSGAYSKEDIGISTAQGKSLYCCSMHSCERYDDGLQIGALDRLLLSVHRTTVRQANTLTGEEQWNFTVSQLQLMMIEGDDDNDFSCQQDHNQWSLHVSDGARILYLTQSSPWQCWSFKFSSPVVDVWLHCGGKLKKLSFSSLSSSSTSSLMLGVYRRQYYIQSTSASHDPLKLSSSSITDLTSQPQSDLPTYLPSSADHLPTDQHSSLVPYYNSKDWLKSFNTDKNPYGLAINFQLKVQPCVHGECSGEENTSEEGRSPSDTPLSKTSSSLPKDNTAMSGMQERVEVYLSMLKFVLFVVALVVSSKIIDMWKSSTIDTDHVETGSHDTHTVLDRGYLSVARRQSAGALKTIEEEEVEDSSCMKTNRSDSTDSTRFESDYDLLGTLGRGGFGVVYHVKNRLDSSEYALKRIKLPVKRFAREKVMREVHALAQLDHPHIVRYFNSWVEKAPPGWDQREEWIPLSRVNSLIQMEDLSMSPVTTPTTPKIPNGMLQFSSSSSSSSFTPSTSATNLLNEIPVHPMSDSSSFNIEFQDDSATGVSNKELSEDYSRCKDTSTNSQALSSSSHPTFHGSSHDDETRTGSEHRQPICHPVDPPTFLFIQMQLCQKESLKDWLRVNIENRVRSTVLSYFQQTLDAVVYVHSKGLMHRDLKPSNIFFSMDGRVKVGDFGLVTANLTPENHKNSYLALKLLGEESNSRRHTGNIGTHFYMSPEQMNSFQYDHKVDIFSLGVILFELNHPFTTEMERAKVLEDIRRQRFPKHFRQHLDQEAQLVEWLMSPVDKRPTAEQVATSDLLRELVETVNHSDITVIPKL